MRRSISWATLMFGLAGTPAEAAITATRDANAVATTLVASGLKGAGFDALPPLKNSGGYDNFPVATAVDDPVGGFPTAGNSYAILSNGHAPSIKAVDGQAVESLSGGNVRGNTDFDVTILKVDLEAPAGSNCLSFDFKMYSREFPIFVGKEFNDAFVAELDKTSWITKDSAITAPDNFAFDPSGRVISVNAAGETSMSKAEAAGTRFSENGATPVLHAYTPVSPGPHSLYLSIFDQKDGAYDSTVLVDNVVARNVPGGCAKGAATGGPKPPPAPAPTPTPSPTPAPAPAAIKPPPAPLPPLPPAFGPKGVFSLPSAKKCVSRRKFRIRVKEKRGFELVGATVFVSGKLVKTLKQKVFGKVRQTATVDLRGMPKGAFKVRIVVLGADGRVITGTRSYRTCGAKGRRNKSPV